MKRKRTVIIWMLLSACSQASNLPDSNVKKMADLECRAISLREQRFALADKIRFAQDTLLHYKTGADTAKLIDSLDSYLKEKEIILQKSLQLADTIHKQLDSLQKFAFTTVNEKHAFDNALREELKKKGCSSR